MTDTALVLVDIQNDYFDGGAWPLHDMDAAAHAASQVLAHARAVNWPVIHVRHVGGPDAPFFRPGSTGANLHPVTAPHTGETVIVKHRPNSFHETGLHARLRQLGVTRLRLVGAMTQMCIDATARAACDLGFGVEIVGDACAARPANWNGIAVPGPQVHAAYLSALDGTYADILTTEDAVA